MRFVEDMLANEVEYLAKFAAMPLDVQAAVQHDADTEGDVLPGRELAAAAEHEAQPGWRRAHSRKPDARSHLAWCATTSRPRGWRAPRS
jgi:hypothetical protein